MVYFLANHCFQIQLELLECLVLGQLQSIKTCVAFWVRVVFVHLCFLDCELVYRVSVTLEIFES